MDDSRITTLADGPVRKLIAVTHGYTPPGPSNTVWGIRTNDDRERKVSTTGRYAVYARQAPGETRVYANIEHVVEKDWREPLSSAFVNHTSPIIGGRLAYFERSRDETNWWYKDTLGRVLQLRVYGTGFEQNFGGWMARRAGAGSLFGILARRTQGIVSRPTRPSVSFEQGLTAPDQCDGLQVFGYSLTRSFADSGMTEIRKVVNREILAGNRFRLEALLVLKNGEDWTGIDELRQAYASPPTVSIKEVVFGRDPGK